MAACAQASSLRPMWRESGPSGKSRSWCARYLNPTDRRLAESYYEGQALRLKACPTERGVHEQERVVRGWIRIWRGLYVRIRSRHGAPATGVDEGSARARGPQDR